MASLLGVLWEVELGQPGFASFLDQNWLEGAERPGGAQHFTAVLAALRRRGLIDEKAGRRSDWRLTADEAREAPLSITRLDQQRLARAADRENRRQRIVRRGGAHQSRRSP